MMKIRKALSHLPLNAVLILVSIIIPTLLYAQVEKIQLKADYTHYNEESKQLHASSNVRLTYGNVSIKASHIKLDTIGNIITSTERVHIKRGEDEFESSYLFFDLNKNIIKLKNINIGVEPPDSKGLLYVKAKEIEDRDSVKLGSHGLFSSCDLDRPHYFVWTQKFKYITDKRIVGYNTILYTPFFLIPFPVPFVTLHYSPIYSYDLGKRKYVWNFPAIGKKETPGWGWFVQNTFDYNYHSINGKDEQSSVMVDWFENKGVGLGIRHVYQWKKNHGSIYFYQLKESDTLNLNQKTQWNQHLRLSDHYKLDLTYLEVDAERINSRGRNEKLNKSAHLFYENLGDKFDISFQENQDFKQQLETFKSNYKKSFNSQSLINANYNETHRREKEYITQETSLTHHLPLPSDIMITNKTHFNKEHYYNEDPFSDEKLKYYFILNKKLSDKLKTTVKIDHFIDLDENRVTQDSVSNKNDFFFRHPEINFNYTNNNFASFTFTEDFTIGRYQEIRFDNTTQKQRIFPEIFGNKMEPNTYIMKQKLSRSFKGLPEKQTLSFSLGFNQYIFKNEGYNLGEGDSMNNLTFTTSHSSTHFNFIKTKSSYSSAYAPKEGNSPFYQFNRASSSRNEINETLTLYLFDASKYYWENKSGYNWITELYRDWNTKLFIKPNHTLQLSLTTGKKLNPQTENEKKNRHLPLISQLKLTPTKNITFNHNISFDLNRYYAEDKATVKNSSFTFDFKLGKKKDYEWKFQTFFTYKTNDKEFDHKQYELQTISLVKEEHKRSVFLRYNIPLEEIQFKLTINAFPSDPIGFRKTKEVWKVEGVLDDTSEERL